MVINQGDIYWIEFDDPVGSEPGYKHPHVVVQNNMFNHSKINTTVVCPFTSVSKRGNIPGNVLIKKGEANMDKDSVISVSQLITVDKTQLEEYIGTISKRRILEIYNGINLILLPREPPE